MIEFIVNSPGAMGFICLLCFGFMFPAPPGILGVLLYQFLFKKQIKRRNDRRRRINEITDKLHREGKLHEELKKADRGESKIFTRL